MLVTCLIRCNRAVDGDVVAIELVAAPEEEKDEQAQRMERQLLGLEGLGKSAVSTRRRRTATPGTYNKSAIRHFCCRARKQRQHKRLYG